MEYYNCLFKQFSEARGYKTIPKDKEKFVEEFALWLADIHSLSNEYRDYAKINSIDLENLDFGELNKGKCDSISLNKSIISPYAHTLGLPNKELVLCQGEPFIKSGSKIIRSQVVDTYGTHNPYDYKDFLTLLELGNNGFEVCMGVFGKYYDSDKKLKLKSMREIASYTDDNWHLEFDELDDNYYCMLRNNSKSKIKTLKM